MIEPVASVALAQTPSRQAHVWRAADIVTMEQAALAQGLPLMERAGLACATLLQQLYPNAKRVGILAGTGNNGGDAWVCARHLLAAGLEVGCFYSQPPATADATQAYQAFQKLQTTEVRDIDSAGLDWADVLVDGLLGSGTKGHLRPQIASIIECINRSATPVLAIDLPSGLESDVGGACAVRAEHTLCLLAYKHALFAPDCADEWVGQIHYCSLGVANEVFDSIQPWYALGLHGPSFCRRANSHKGDYGCVWIIGGQGISEGMAMAGAVLLGARASARCGCGLVKVLTHKDHAGQLATGFADAIYLDADRDLDGADTGKVIRLIGPGLGMSAWSRRVFSQAIDLPGSALIDADALNLLAEKSQPGRRSEQWLLTPHPLEAARLLGVDVAQIQQDRFAAVRAIADEFGGVAVLKGRASLISDGDQVALCPYGNPAMACAGMGDVLAGVIAALMAQGLDLMSSATQGVCLHALTADRILATSGWGMTATDVADSLWVGAPDAIAPHP